MKPALLLLLAAVFINNAVAQYTVNGNATKDNCNCYTLTKNINTQSGSVWNNNKINLSQSFNFTFDVFLGCNDVGADGIAFVLQPISTSVGSSGSGMGFEGINPSVGVTLDTYQNTNTTDPVYDHIAIQLNGDVNHSSANTITPLTPISASNNNVEDCQTHILQIIWDASSKNLSVYFDGILRVTATQDFVSTVFSGNPQLFWGFTAATGGENNLQKFCTSLKPNFFFAPDQKTCFGEPILFKDSTLSFGGIVKHYWNFGDGSNIDSVNISPTHIYATPGNYNVSLSVLAADSCTAVYNRLIIVGSKPVADFAILDSCQNKTLRFSDSSFATIGTINKWFWQFDNTQTSAQQNPVQTFNSYGNKNIKLVVTSIEGCVSDTLYKNIYVNAQPLANFSFMDSVCLGSPTNFSSSSTLADGNLTNFLWSFSDSAGLQNSSANTSHLFTTTGSNQTSLVVSGAAGCKSEVVSKPVFIMPPPTAAFLYSKACEGELIQFTDTSFTLSNQSINYWAWDFGDGQTSFIKNPQIRFISSGIKNITLVVRNSKGCYSDTLRKQIMVAAKPNAEFGISDIFCNSTPIQFFDSSLVSNATITQWNWIQAGSVFANTQNASFLFPSGNQQAGLVVKSADGCTSDTTFKSFTIKTKPGLALFLKDTCKLAIANFSAAETGTNVGISLYKWNFGDGNSIEVTQNNLTHIYLQNGIYPVTLIGISNEGCPSDTLQKNITIYGTNANAGRDTIAAAGQPIQLQAGGGLSYSWSPASGLNNASIKNPVATNLQDKTYYLKAFTPEGCASYDTLNIKVYLGPEIYVPTAFTPNRDGLNDVLKPIAVGIAQFDYFTVYNRYGQVIFKANNATKGWDGRINGKEQNTGTYIWMVAGTDYRGNKIFRKGSVLLIR